MTASSVPSMLSEWMNISLTQLNWLSNVSAILTTLVSLLSPLAYDVLGIKLSVNEMMMPYEEYYMFSNVFVLFSLFYAEY